MTNVVTFHRIYPAATLPLRADKSALGTLPAAAFQYCESVRTASLYGWYVFPPLDIHLMFDGVDIKYRIDDNWTSLAGIHINDFMEYWDEYAPADLKGRAPPFVIQTFVPGILQVWSGLLVSTADAWSVLIGPPSNLPQNRAFACYEGIVETDSFKPCPLFVNIRLLTTDREIFIPKMQPLFQVRPLKRDCYADATLRAVEHEGLSPRIGDTGSMSEEDWIGLRSTMRSVDSPTHIPGSHGADRRRRAKRDAG